MAQHCCDIGVSYYLLLISVLVKLCTRTSFTTFIHILSSSHVDNLKGFLELPLYCVFTS